MVAACFCCFAGEPGHERGFAAAALLEGSRTLATGRASGEITAAYEPGLLALREGALLEAAIARVGRLPDALIVNATGRDHPRRAGLAIHLGAVVGLPTVGVTHRPLVATGELPDLRAGATTPITLEGEIVGHWLVTRAAVRPVVVHPGWRTDPAQALEIVRTTVIRARTPEPLRRARELARRMRTKSTQPKEGNVDGEEGLTRLV